jgi:hypothetical protein
LLADGPIVLGGARRISVDYRITWQVRASGRRELDGVGDPDLGRERLPLEFAVERTHRDAKICAVFEWTFEISAW